MLSPRATARDMAQIWEKAKLKEDTDTDHSSEHAQEEDGVEEDGVEESVTGYTWTCPGSDLCNVKT